VLDRPPATDVTRYMQVQPPNTPLFRAPQAVAAAVAQTAAEAWAWLTLSGTQGELFALLDGSQRRKLLVDSAKSAFTYEDFRSNQLGVRFFHLRGAVVNAASGELARAGAFRDALRAFFASIAVENSQAEVDRHARGLPMQEQFSAGKTTEETERERHPELFRTP
jgi:hypothetical protein